MIITIVYENTSGRRPEGRANGAKRPSGYCFAVSDPVVGTTTGSFVGRDRELARVVDMLDEAGAGRGRLVLLIGEAGIGKTRLAEEVAAIARARGISVTWARSTDRDSSPPYGLWRLAQLFDGPAHEALSSGLESDQEQRFVLFNEVRKRLTHAAEPAGLLLVLDDVQWADEPSLALLRHVVQQLRGTRALIVATCRDSSRSDDPNGEKIRALASDTNAERLELRGLDPGAVRKLLAAAGLDGSQEQADAMHAETDGNPFLLREVTRLLVEHPDASSAPVGAVPGVVLDVTTRRIGQMTDGSQGVLRAAAVAGNSFSIGVVAQMLEAPTLSLLESVEECQAAGFLVAGDRPGDYRFSHALVRSAVVARLSAPDQLRLHNAGADAIERLFEGQLRSHLAELAHHRVQGSLPGDRLRAVTACEAAGDVAAEDLAFEEAVRLYREALSIGQGEISELDRGRLDLALAGALYRSGDLPAWHDAVVEVARRAERMGDRLLLARAALAMEATGDTEWDSEILRICEQALVGRGLADDLRARVLSRYAQALMYRGEYERALEVSQEALDVAESTGDPATLIEALRARQLACCAPEGATERAVLAARMLEASEEVRSASVEMWGRLWRLDTLFETGQLTRISRELADLAVCVERVRGPLAKWHHLEYSATLAQGTGRFADAISIGADAFALINDMGHPLAFGTYAAILGMVGMHIGFEASGSSGLMATIPAHLAPGSGGSSRVVSVFPALTFALISLDQGDRDGAVRAYDQAGPIRSWNPSAALRLSCWAHGLPVAIALERTDDVAYLATRFEPFRGRHVANGAGAGVYFGPVELQLGRAASALGHLDAAVADLETAAGICDEIGAPGFSVQASVELADALLRRDGPGDRRRALTVLDNTKPNAERLGMAPFVERIDALGSRVSPVGSASGLSPREREVAALVGKGLTNRQIAEALYVSERTAQNHVQHILTKLGFDNRSQIAVWANKPE